MKKILVLLAAVGALALFAGCDNGTTSGTETPNYTALNAKILEAEAAKDGVVIDTAAGNVAQGRQWVTQSAMTNFDQAIGAAKAARAATTQADVDAAESRLSDAITAFNSAKQNGTKTPDQQDLYALIADANAAKDGVTVSVNGSDVSPQEYWVTRIVMNALDTAISAAQNPSGSVTDAYSALLTALNTFRDAKKAGTGKAQRTITINGLEQSLNGEYIYLALFETTEISMNEEPAIMGSGEIQNGTVTVTLYNTSDDTPWTGSGSYYVGFGVVSDGRAYISRSKIPFSDNAANVVKNFSDFKPYVYKITFGDIAESMGITIPANGMTLDEWCQMMMNMTYAQMLEAGGIPGPVYKNEALTQPFSGSDRIYANTTIYSTFDLMGGGGDNRTQIGELSGTITLTDVTGSPRLRLSVNGGSSGNWWYGDRQLTLTGSSASQTLNWSIPIYAEGGNGGFSSSQVNFYLNVQPTGSGNGFEVRIPTNTNITSANQSGIALGSVSIKSITLSGTITVTHNGQPVPYVEIAADEQYGQGWIGSTDLTSPGNNAAWSMVLPAITGNVTFRVYGYQDRNYNQRLFNKELDTPVVPVTGANVSGITLTVGNVQTITLSGTISVTYNGQRVPNVEISAYTFSGQGWTQFSSPAAGASWSITMIASASEEQVSFSVRGYDGNWDNLFYREVTLTPSVTVSNQNKSGIVLNLGNITP